jgi:TldD protein
MKKQRSLASMMVVVAGIALASLLSPGSTWAASPVLDAMQAELDRSMDVLKGQPQPPYFLSYEVVDQDQASVTATFGTITSSDVGRRRSLLVDLRVGDYKLDSTHQLRGDFGGGNSYSFVEVPLQDDPDAIRSVIWFETDKAYKKALEQFTKVNTQVAVKVAEEDRSDDFSREKPAVFEEAPAPFTFDRAAWEQKLRRYTAPFTSHGDIYQADGMLSAGRQIRWFVNSEGSRIQTTRYGCRLAISAMTKADDGMELPLYRTFFSYTEQGMPDDATILAEVAEMIRDFDALRKAPIVDPYTGPAILSGRSSAVFFHEIFGHRVEGHRQRNEEEGQTFKKMVGQSVLPANFSVIFDPSLQRMVNTDLNGFYRYDDQGVPGSRVVVVDHGILKDFLMSRKPIENFPVSNGHARCQPGMSPVSRQSNLVVQVDQPVTYDKLKEMLIEQIKAEGKPFGLIFDDIVGGFTMTGRFVPNAFNVTPVMVYRVFPDGRQELVRGVDLIGTPLTSFSKILAADDNPAVFNGTCGAESGGVPVSAVSPAILVGQIEVQKKEKSQERPPLLGAPERKTLEW